MDSKPKKSNLKPLRGESPTGFWTYLGKPLEDYEIKTLEAKGVIFKPHPEGDLFPDGKRMKLPKHRKVWTGRSLAPRTIQPEDLKEKQEQRWQEYLALPEPKDDYIEWASRQSRRDQFDELELLAKTAGRSGDRIKAINTLLEFSKSRPKQIHEVKNVEDDIPALSKADILALALKENDIEPQLFKQVLDALRTKENRQEAN